MKAKPICPEHGEKVRIYKRNGKSHGLQCLQCERKRRSIVHKNNRHWHRKSKYGLANGVVETMLKTQNDCCAICGDEIPVPFIDHCHATNIVRGLLCRHCNLGLGHFKDSCNRLQNAISYLKRAPIE